MDNKTVPTDVFSTELRRLEAHPGAIRAESTVRVTDFYGNTETWVVETFRVLEAPGRAAEVTVFLQRNSVDGGQRLVLMPGVTAALDRHATSLVARARKRAANRALETRRLRGDVIGNPDALKKARQARRKKGSK